MNSVSYMGIPDNLFQLLDFKFAGNNLSAVKRAENKKTGSLRVAVEWMYKNETIYWKNYDSKPNCEQKNIQWPYLALFRCYLRFYGHVFIVGYLSHGTSSAKRLGLMIK